MFPFKEVELYIKVRFQNSLEGLNNPHLPKFLFYITWFHLATLLKAVCISGRILIPLVSHLILT